ncbi:MAG TPA: hypothetical protein GX695_05370 [Acholeplasmataceae bacterium]|nr:hypothetical protein [Acholeplasmataceae bacterium]
MTIYIFIFITSWSSSYLYSRSKDSNASAIFCILTFFFLFIPAALRYNIGTDYKNYVAIFNKILYTQKASQEPGFLLLNQTIQKVGLGSQWVFISVSFLTYFFLFKSIEKKDFYLAIPIYILVIYGMSYSAIRQALVMSMSMYAIKLFFDKKTN